MPKVIPYLDDPDDTLGDDDPDDMLDDDDDHDADDAGDWSWKPPA